MLHGWSPGNTYFRMHFSSASRTASSSLLQDFLHPLGRSILLHLGASYRCVRTSNPYIICCTLAMSGLLEMTQHGRLFRIHFQGCPGGTFLLGGGLFFDSFWDPFADILVCHGSLELPLVGSNLQSCVQGWPRISNSWSLDPIFMSCWSMTHPPK